LGRRHDDISAVAAFYFDSSPDNPYHLALMLDTFSRRRLPQHISPRKFAHSGVEIRAGLPVSALSRLQDLLADDSGQASVELTFFTDGQRNHCLTGHAAADLTLVCQRCLKPLVLSIQCQLNLMMVDSDKEAERLSAPWEPWLVDNEQVDLYQLIEDELLLALPLVARHRHNCLPLSLFSYGCDTDDDALAAQSTEEEAGFNNPFGVLENLKDYCQ